MKTYFRISVLLGVLVVLAATLLPEAAAQRKSKRSKKAESPAVTREEAHGRQHDGEKPQAPEAAAAQGTLDIDITSVSGQNAPSRVELIDDLEGPTQFVEVPTGRTEAPVRAGSYRAYVYVYDGGVPVLVDVQDLSVPAGGTRFLLVNLFEGSSVLPLRDFDSDGDLAIDRVEILSGTNPRDAREIPGRAPIPYNTRVLAQGEKWFRGELHARSRHGGGKESVAELIRRAERAGLDFLAITDRNTMASVFDPAYKSDKLVLIPAMEWGDDANGVALIYAPRTLPDPPLNFNADEAQCVRVQAQGGVFAIAHPCFPTAPWKRGLGYVNAVEVWCRGWREVPPLNLKQLPEPLQVRHEGKLVHSIAAAAKLSDLDLISANAQAERFWDFELGRGLIAGVIAGSQSSSDKVPMGQPITYIRAANKSLPAIMDGLQRGQTFVSSGVNGPKLYLRADIDGDKKWDVSMGGIVPMWRTVTFEAFAENAKGLKLEVIRDGRPVFTKIIEGDGFYHRFEENCDAPSSYRARIISPAPEGQKGFGPLQIHAMTSPIFAREVSANPKENWIRIEPEADLPVVIDESQPPSITPQSR